MSVPLIWRPPQHIRPISLALVQRQKEILVMTVRDGGGNVKGYRPPGGGIEFGETAAEAVKREFLEEFDLSIRNIKRIIILENIYHHEGATGHEIVFVHTAEYSNSIPILKNDYSFVDGGVLNESGWVSIQDFKSGRLTLFPDGLAEHLIG